MQKLGFGISTSAIFDTKLTSLFEWSREEEGLALGCAETDKMDLQERILNSVNNKFINSHYLVTRAWNPLNGDSSDKISMLLINSVL